MAEIFKQKREILTHPLSRQWKFDESEFIAENELITIIPDFSSDKLVFLQVIYFHFHFASIKINI